MRSRRLALLFPALAAAQMCIRDRRFADTIERLGFEYVEDKLLNGRLDKAAVMQKTVVGGEMCIRDRRASPL